MFNNVRKISVWWYGPLCQCQCKTYTYSKSLGDIALKQSIFCSELTVNESFYFSYFFYNGRIDVKIVLNIQTNHTQKVVFRSEIEHLRHSFYSVKAV